MSGRVPCRGSYLQEYRTISTNFRHNEQIRISPIRLINDKEEQVGVVSTAEALRMAREAGLDLVEVAPTARPPVCRIMDYGKWRYQQQKKEDKSRASNKGGRLKKLNIDTVRIGDHDLEIKINHARDFLKEGNKVQFTLRFKGREMAHLDLGRDSIQQDEAGAVPGEQGRARREDGRPADDAGPPAGPQEPRDRQAADAGRGGAGGRPPRLAHRPLGCGSESAPAARGRRCPRRHAATGCRAGQPRRNAPARPQPQPVTQIGCGDEMETPLAASRIGCAP